MKSKEESLNVERVSKQSPIMKESERRSKVGETVQFLVYSSALSLLLKIVPILLSLLKASSLFLHLSS